jgi:hypothetical protein
VLQFLWNLCCVRISGALNALGAVKFFPLCGPVSYLEARFLEISYVSAHPQPSRVKLCCAMSCFANNTRALLFSDESLEDRGPLCPLL